MRKSSELQLAELSGTVVDRHVHLDRRDRRRDGLFRFAVTSCGIIVLIALASAAVSMLIGGREAFATFGWKFFWSKDWDAVHRQFGAIIPIYGTLVTALLAMIFAVPVAFGIAVFVTEIVPGWLRLPIISVMDLLAGIPSIIYGMWGLFVFVPFMAKHVDPWLNDHVGSLPFIGTLFHGPNIGLGMLTAGIVLGIMVLPFIAAVMREVFNTVPSPLKESAYALGSTAWEVVWQVVLPYTRSAVTGGIFLGMGRALGETMAVTFVLGNAHRLSLSLLEPGNSIAATIANEFTEADSSLYLSSLVALGFILFIVTFIVIGIARLMLRRMQRLAGNLP